jgi:hypothetical protein
LLTVLAASLVVLVVAVVAWKLRKPKLPSPSDDVAVLAKFVRTDQYKDLSEADKRPFAKALRHRSAELAAARAEGRISDKDYAAGYLNGWFERKLDDMNEYFATPADKRKATLAKHYAKKVRTAATAPSATAPASADVAAPDGEAEDSFVKHRVSTWPPEQRAKWEEFKKATKEAKELAKAGR